MIRAAIARLIEAAKLELGQIFDDVDVKNSKGEPAPVVASAPAVNPWESPTYHLEVLKSSVCPTCGEEKDAGSYFCGRCITSKRATA